MPAPMKDETNTRLKRDEGRRRASLHFAEDFVLTLDEIDKGIYRSNANLLQSISKHNFGHNLNPSMLAGLMIFFSEERLHKDNQFIFDLASFMCDMLDDRLDLRKRG